MRARDLVAGVTVVLVCVVMSGCQSAVSGSPTTASTPAGGGASPSTSDRLAPPVENPKNLRGVDPCQLLTSEQQSQLSLTGSAKKDTSLWGEEKCVWFGSVVGMVLSPETTSGEGLEKAYRAKNNFDNFAESTVDGYPAVRVDFATQSCGLVVGVSDTQTLHMEFTRVSSSAPGDGDPCGFAESVLGEVIKTLPDA